MVDFFSKLFDTSDFPPRWHCGLWTDGHGWLHIVSDLGIWSAYFAIPLLLLFFVRHRRDVPFRRIFLLFGAFILLCGSTHLMEAAIFWWPGYRLAGLLKFATAVVSWTTVAALIPVIPTALALRSPQALEEEVRRRTEELRRANDALTAEVTERKKTEAALRKSEERLRVTLASIGDGVITTDAEGQADYLNPVAELLTGWTTSEAAGKPLAEVFRIENEATRQRVENPVEKVLKEGVTVGLANHTILICKDGTERPIDDSAAPIRDTDGRLLGVVLVFRDVAEARSAERRLRESEGRFQVAADAAPVLIWLAGTDKLCHWFNKPWLEFTGRTIDEEYGYGWAEGVHPDDLERCVAIYNESFDSHQPFTLEYRLRRHDGEYRWVLDSGVPRFDSDGGEFSGYIGSCIDITDLKTAGEAIRESEAQFRTLAEAVPPIVWVANPLGAVEFFNGRWYEYTGMTPEQSTGGGWSAALHPDDKARTEADWKQATETGVPYEIEYRILRHDEIYRWFLGRALPVRNETGEITRWFGTCTDIDDAKRAEQKAAFLADASAHLAVLLDPRSTLQKIADAAVPAFADWLAVDLLDADGNHERLAVTHADRDKVRLASELAEKYPFRTDDPHGVGKVYRTGEPELVSDVPESLLKAVVRDDGHLQLLRKLGYQSYMSVPLPSQGRTVGVLTLVTGPSSRRYDEADLAVAEDLGRRVAVAVENARLYEALKEADQRKDEFLATLAHELRNPLAPIRMGLEVLRLGGGDPETMNEMLDTMEGQVRQMVRLIDDLLDVSRITQGKLELRTTRIELKDVVKTALEAVRPVITESAHDFTLSLPEHSLPIEADPARLSQVFSNLLNNSAKYTPEGGKISLAAERQGSDVVVSVRDTGIGIPPEMLEKVFEMFTQVDRTLERSTSGLGIGLTLVRRLVEMHGGTVVAKSGGEGQGSEFLVRLPLIVSQRVEPQQGDGTLSPTGNRSGRRILVADDNRDAAELLGRVLRALGHEVHLVYDGQAAVEAAESYRPDVCLLDIGMPKLNGYDAALTIRREPWGKKLLLVALTGWGAEEDRRRSREAGFDRHLVKPVEPAALQELLSGPRISTS